MKGNFDTDRTPGPPPKIRLLEDRIFAALEEVHTNRDYVMMKNIGAIDVILKIDSRLAEMDRLQETYRMAVLPDGGLKWMVLGGRNKMGSEMVHLSRFCQEFYDKLVMLCEATCRHEGFRKAKKGAEEQLRHLLSETYKKQFKRDIWVPDTDKLPKYLEDDEWFRGLAEGLSKTLLGLVSAASKVKEAFVGEFDLIFASAAAKIEELAKAGIPVPGEYRGYTDQSLIARQKTVFHYIPLPQSEAMLARYLAESMAFVGAADAVLEIRNGLDTMVRRMVLYHEFFKLELEFPHHELDSYIGYLSPLDKSEEETEYLLQYLDNRKADLEAQKNYYLVRLWRMSPQILERTRRTVEKEAELFRRQERTSKARMTDAVRMLKAHGQEHREDLQKLEHFDKENDAAISRLPSDMDHGPRDEELVETLKAFKKCMQVRIEEYFGLASHVREEAARARQMAEGGSLPEDARRRLLSVVGELDLVQFTGKQLPWYEQYCSAVEYYEALCIVRKRMAELCFQLVKGDLVAICRQFEELDRKYVSYFATVSRKCGLPEALGGQSPAWLLTVYELAHEMLFTEEERLISAYRQALLESAKGRLERAERSIALEEVARKLEQIAAFGPRRPASPKSGIEMLKKMQQELFSKDLLSDAQQYWIKVSELCKAISASIRVHLDASMVTEEDRKASWEASLDKLDSRLVSLMATLEGRLKEIDANMAQLPEFKDLRLSPHAPPGLKDAGGSAKALPGLRLAYLDGYYKAIHVAREMMARELVDFAKGAEALHLPVKFTAKLKFLSGANLDGAVVGFAALRMAMLEWINTTVRNICDGLGLPMSEKWDLSPQSAMGAWLAAYDDFLDLMSETARAAIEEAADLRDRLASSDEAVRIRKKSIARHPMNELLKASDSAQMKDIAYLLFESEGDIETVRRRIELAQGKLDLQGILDGCCAWRLLRGRLEAIAASRCPPGDKTLLESLQDFEERRIREYDLSKNKARFPDRALIEDLERAIIRCKLRGKKIPAREFLRLVAAVQKEGEANLKDWSDEFLISPGEYPEYRLKVEPADPSGLTRCSVRSGEKYLEFYYDPRRMTLQRKRK